MRPSAAARGVPARYRFVAVAIVRSDAAEITKALAGDLLAFRA